MKIKDSLIDKIYNTRNNLAIFSSQLKLGVIQDGNFKFSTKRLTSNRSGSKKESNIRIDLFEVHLELEDKKVECYCAPMVFPKLAFAAMCEKKGIDIRNNDEDILFIKFIRHSNFKYEIIDCEDSGQNYPI